MTNETEWMMFSSPTSQRPTVPRMADRPRGDLDPIAAQLERSKALFNPQSPQHAPEIRSVSIPEIERERDREQRTGVVRVEQRGHFLPDEGERS